MKEIEKEKRDLDKLYFKIEKYISDLNFYKDDLTFLQHLLDKYFTEMMQIENHDEMRETMIRLQDLKYNGERLLENSKKYLLKLAKIIDGSSNAYKEGVSPKDNTLKESVQDFTRKFRETKMELFSIAEHVLELQKRERKIKEEK